MSLQLEGRLGTYVLNAYSTKMLDPRRSSNVKRYRTIDEDQASERLHPR